MYHPPDLLIGTNHDGQRDDEYIESAKHHRQFRAAVDPNFATNSWRLRDAVDYDFPTNTSIGPGTFILVVSFGPFTNAPRWPLFVPQRRFEQRAVFGPFSGKLDNSSDSVNCAGPTRRSLQPRRCRLRAGTFWSSASSF